MPPPPGGMAGVLSFSLISHTSASVVSRRAAIDAAFCSAVRVTFVGLQWSHFHGCCLLIEIHVLVFEIQLGDLPGVSSWSGDNYWITHRLARKVGLFTNLAFS